MDSSDYKDQCFFPFSYQMVGTLAGDTSDYRNSSSLYGSM